MSLTYTPTGELGRPCPEFKLPGVDGLTYARADFSGPLLVMFICNHCPYVRAIEARLLELAHEYIPRGINCVAICANDSADHPEDAPAELRRRWEEFHYGFPYLIDAEQSVAKAFGAVCTPDLYVFNESHKLFYRGRLDDSWRNPSRVTQNELRSALDLLLADRPPPELQNPSMGCSIKWKKE